MARLDEASAEVCVWESVVKVEYPDGSWAEYAMERLPSEFLEWQVASRRAVFDRIETQREVLTFGAHLPVVATFNSDAAFPLNTANKGVGLMPTEARLEECLGLLRDCLDRIEGASHEQSRSERLAAVREFHDHPEWIDTRRLGSLEIFEGTTFHNLRLNPVASLHYTGPGPEYRSYQVNVVAEIVTAADPRYQFIYAMRYLFEYERFHLHRSSFPYGYIFWVVGVRDKTPRSREAQEE